MLAARVLKVGPDLRRRYMTEQEIGGINESNRKYLNLFTLFILVPGDLSRADFPRTINRDSTVGIASVIGFPKGTHSTQVKSLRPKQPLRTVQQSWIWSSLKRGDLIGACSDTLAICQFARIKDVNVKVILETSQLTHSETLAAMVKACEPGAVFVKTSTGGFLGPGATVEKVGFMRAVCDGWERRGWKRRVRVKASGGVRTLGVLGYLDQSPVSFLDMDPFIRCLLDVFSVGHRVINPKAPTSVSSCSLSFSAAPFEREILGR